MLARLTLTAFAVTLLNAGDSLPRPTGAVAPACRPLAFEGSRFTICTARSGDHRIRLADLDAGGRPLRQFSTLKVYLGTDARRVAFAMNAGMYDLGGRPIGLHVEAGVEQAALSRRDGSGNFHLKPNGVFYGDAGGWHVAATDAFAAHRPRRIDFATQSGPMLVIEGRLHPAFAPDGTSKHIRNGVGIDEEGNAIFAISEERVSFGRFARLFRDELGCRDALYLDGSISRLWDPAAGREDRGAPLGPMVVVLDAGG
ncbi:phosphodiester glycosidase family protein [Sphingomonas sanxanigenens]|uniref:Phosphodiester glycosidase domain-containing protein n=1 Tax=Sphingomonas sanxanigenens DSM 19645 = NX02 TaxID=1123269 RepID=W0ABQ4_9SPHN|nr:phosphodiester glycosidase family protein [Sphingomonas sanxanigenens]AHE54501.1 hypothetical protein NX02_14055 [Sphingomonas sanxanigenens DSM 19645 = NX02]